MLLMKTDLRATWLQAIMSLSVPIIIVMTIRWALFEPYIIPSGSMLPNLLIHDHVLVNKFVYGLRLPFGKKYVVEWGKVERGDIIVFRYPRDETVFYVKRAIGLPGETIRWEGHEVYINDVKIDQADLGDGFFQELHWRLQYQASGFAEEGEYKIPEDEVFVMGDHRDNSSDSRVWGGVKTGKILGRVSRIWMACSKMLDPSVRLCDPSTIRWDRIWKIP